MSTYDHATPERRAWIARMQSGQKPASWLLAKPINDRADPLVDIDYQKRADRAWDVVREMGNRETVNEERSKA